MAIQEKFPSIRPSLNLDFANTKTLDPRIAFSRASEGRYYDGKTVAKAEENLLLYSQEFDNNYWVKANVTVTANTQVAPDGTTTADLIVENTATGPHSVVHASYNSPEIFTYSFYAKAGTRSWVWAYFNGYNGGSAWFDVGNGVIGTVESGVSATITSVGNGWYRCTLTKRNATFASSVVIAIATGSGSTNYTGDGTSGIYIWGAQLEQRHSVTAYTATTTQPITNYVPVLRTAAANVARFDHNPVTGESLGLLIEEQRTNLLLWSQEFSGGAGWGITDISITPNVVVAPDGTLTADKAVESATTGVHRFSGGTTISTNTTYTASVYVKAAERRFFGLKSGIAGQTETVFDLLNGTVVGGVGSIVDVGNGWYRCSNTFNSGSSTSHIAYWTILPSANFGAESYTGDGTSGIYIWGAQLEAGAFPTSYIKTEASQVTRSADHAVMTGTNFSSWYRADEGTVLAEFNSVSGGTTLKPVFSIDAGSIANEWLFGRTQTTGLFWTIDANSANQGNTTTSIVLDANNKAAFGLKRNDVAVSFNGKVVATDTSVVVPVLVNRFTIGNEPQNRRANSTIKKIAYYPQRLTNTQLQALTS